MLLQTQKNRNSTSNEVSVCEQRQHKCNSSLTSPQLMVPSSILVQHLPNTTAPHGHDLSSTHEGSSSMLMPLATSAASVFFR